MVSWPGLHFFSTTERISRRFPLCHSQSFCLLSIVVAEAAKAATADEAEFARIAQAAAGPANQSDVAAGRAAFARERAASLRRQRAEAVAEQLNDPVVPPEPVDDFEPVSSDDDDDISPLAAVAAAGVAMDLDVAAGGPPVVNDDQKIEGYDPDWEANAADYEAARAHNALVDLHRNLGGRPRLAPPPLTEPAWRSPLADDAAAMTLQQLIDALLQVQIKHNGSHALFADMFELLRGVLPRDGPEVPPRLPEYRRVRELMSQPAHADMKEFALCPRDCALQPLADLDAAQLSALKQSTCHSCGQKYSENGKEFDKVRAVMGSDGQWAAVLAIELLPDGMLIFYSVHLLLLRC